jgi:chloride channel protein, CIC family
VMASCDARAQAQANARSTLAELSGRFWLLALLTGGAAGLGAIAMMGILRTVQHAAFSYNGGPYSNAVAAHGDLRRVLVLTGGGVVAGVGWFVIRRFLGGTGGSPTGAVWTGKDELSLWRTLLSGGLSEVVIGLGASLGREAAPQHAAAAFGSWIARKGALPREQRLLLIACGAGAGVGAVYNVPLAGALFAAELYLGSISVATIVPALVTSAVATAVGWTVLGTGVVYTVAGTGRPTASLLVFAALAGPVLGLAAAAFVRMIGWASDHRPTGYGLLIQPPVAFAALGALAIAYPLLLGNGRDLAQFAFTGGGALGALAALALLKPMVTTLCLRCGATGGLFTPLLSFGAVLGALLGHLWAHVWPGAEASVCALAGAAALLAAGMQAPVAALAFTIELTGTVNASMVAILLAVGGALVVARRLEPRSIYSARLPAAAPGEAVARRVPPEGIDFRATPRRKSRSVRGSTPEAMDSTATGVSVRDDR